MRVRQVERLEYEVYRPVAEKEGARIIDEAIERLVSAMPLCIHREGLLELGEIAVIVCVSSPHRGAAFDACRYIIDETKTKSLCPSGKKNTTSRVSANG